MGSLGAYINDNLLSRCVVNEVDDDYQKQEGREYSRLRKRVGNSCVPIKEKRRKANLGKLKLAR